MGERADESWSKNGIENERAVITILRKRKSFAFCVWLKRHFLPFLRRTHTTRSAHLVCIFCISTEKLLMKDAKKFCAYETTRAWIRDDDDDHDHDAKDSDLLEMPRVFFRRKIVIFSGSAGAVEAAAHFSNSKFNRVAATYSTLAGQVVYISVWLLLQFCVALFMQIVHMIFNFHCCARQSHHLVQASAGTLHILRYFVTSLCWTQMESH